MLFHERRVALRIFCFFLLTFEITNEKLSVRGRVLPLTLTEFVLIMSFFFLPVMLSKSQAARALLVKESRNISAGYVINPAAADAAIVAIIFF